MELVAANLYPLEVLDAGVMQHMTGYERKYVPGSDYLDETLSVPLSGFFSSRKHYTQAFDKFEYLLGLYHASHRQNIRLRGPAGCFLWRGRENIHKIKSQPSLMLNWPNSKKTGLL